MALIQSIVSMLEMNQSW